MPKAPVGSLSDASSDPHDAASSGTIQPADAAHYIAEMSAELAALAKQSGHEFLAYLLQMASLEASGNLPLAVRARSPRQG